MIEGKRVYEYKFVKVDLGGLMTRKPREDYHRLVEQYAEQGWRLVQVFAPSISVGAGGAPDYFELIFEKETK
jgi:hypothetical protein